MSPESAFILMIPAHVFKWLGLIGGAIALCGLVVTVHAFYTAGEETDQEMRENDL